MSYATARRRDTNRDLNKLYPEDQAVHGWYRFVLSFPPHLVRDYLRRFEIAPGATVLDPFCGTGTTLVECKKLALASIGLEANPMAAFASGVKLDWSLDPDGLLAHAEQVAEAAQGMLQQEGIDDAPALVGSIPPKAGLRRLSPEREGLLLRNSISPLPLHKALLLLECLDRDCDPRYHRHELLALAKALVNTSGNLHFGPEVGVGPAKPDAPVIEPWLEGVRAICRDLRDVQSHRGIEAEVHGVDSRSPGSVLSPNSVDAVITSPPYPNEKDYTRTTRLESVLLHFIKDKADLRRLKQGLVRSNTRTVYQADADDQFITKYSEIERLAREIEARRIELGKTSGFERLYARVTRLYFGGMARHLAELRPILRRDAQLAYVVGDQASFFRVMIRTGELLAMIASDLGYEVVSIDLFRTRLATATRAELREEVVLLRWPGTDAGLKKQRLWSTAPLQEVA
jgi:hypothetical protein